MTDVIPTITEDNAMTTLCDFIAELVSCLVVRTQSNRVPMPKADFIAVTQKSLIPLSTNVNTNTATVQSILRPVQFTVQIDCYGTLSFDRCCTISTLLRDWTATDFFNKSGYDMQTLYAGDAIQLPLVTGEKQYLERWTFDAILQLNPVINLTTQTANTLTVDLINVEAEFPA